MYEYPPPHQQPPFNPASPPPVVAPAAHLPKSTGYQVAIGLLAAVAVVALTGCGLLGWKLHQQSQISAQERTALQQLRDAAEQERAASVNAEEAHQAAVSYAQLLTSIDYKTIDDTFQKILDGATGDFKEKYGKSSVQLRQMLIDNQATSHSVVLDSAIQSHTDHAVVVLLFVDQTVTNKATPQSKVDRSRIKMTMDEIGDRWLASKVELP